MHTYLITYDLKAEGQAYQDISDAIQLLGEAKRLLTTTWILKTGKSVFEILHKLASVIDDTDKLLVAKLSPETMGEGFSDEDAEWLNITS